MDLDMSGKTPEDAAGKSGGLYSAPEAARGTGGDWGEVARALDALGASIARAANAAVDNDETKRRLRELSDGLASLARHAGQSIGAAAATPEGAKMQRVVAQAAETVREAGEQAAETVREAGDQAAAQLRPHVLSAINAANEKFRKAAAQWETPPEKPITSFADLAEPADGAPETAPAATAASPVSEASSEGSTSETSPFIATNAPARIFESAPVSTDKLDAVRVAHERFVAERKAAEGAAAASKAAAGAPKREPLKDESVIGPEPNAGSADSDEAPLW